MTTSDTANDRIVGGAGNDQLYGYGGQDTLVGGGGRDYLDGGDGADLLQGGEGDDSYLFSNGQDWIDDAGGTETLILRSSTNFANLSFVRSGSNLLIQDKATGNQVTIVDHFGAGAVERLRLPDMTVLDLRSGLLTSTANTVLGSTGVDTLTGTEAADEIRAGAGADALYGKSGADTLCGEAGNDYLDGGDGDDRLLGGDGNDSYLFSAGRDTISDSAGSWDVITLRGSASVSDLTFSQSGSDLVITDARLGSELVVKDHFGGGTVEYLKQGGELLDLRTVLQPPSTGGGLPSPSAPSPAPPPVEAPAQAPAQADFTLRPTEHAFGGVGENHYRGAGFADRVIGDGNPNEAAVVQVKLGATVAQIEDMIAKAAPGTTFQLQAGTYVFDQQLDIRRSDVTLKGAGDDKTVIQAKVVGGDVIRVQAPWQKEALGNIEPSEAKLNTTLASAADDHATVVQLKSVAGLQVGDFLEISQPYYGYRDDANDGFKGALAEISSIDAATGRVTLAHQLGFDAVSGATVRGVTLLHDVVLGDFTIDYGAPLNPVNAFRYNNDNPQYVGAESGMGSVGTRAIFLNSVTDTDLFNITVRNAGSNAVFVREAVEVGVNGLTVDGVQNLGDGGNGYGLEIARTYFSDFDNLTFKGLVRHAVTYAKDGSSGFNNVHILSTSANVDFHGGPDYSNIYYVENMSLPLYKDDYAHPAVDYRDANNVWENVAIVDNLVAPDAVKISRYMPGYAGVNITGSDLPSAYNDYSAARDDLVYGGAAGSKVALGGGNDTFHSGPGDDTVATGAGADVIAIHAGGGHDVVTDFDPLHDTVRLERGLFGAITEILGRIVPTAEGADIDLGGGAHVLLAGVDARALAANDFGFL